MNNKREIIIVIIGLIAAFSFGRYSVDDTSAVQITQQTKTKERTDSHTQTKTVTTKKPDGTVSTITTTDTVASTHETQNSNTQVTQTPAKRSKVNVSALIAYDIHTAIPTYGIAVSKELIGPITVGAFGLTSGTIGLSVGLNF